MRQTNTDAGRTEQLLALGDEIVARAIDKGASVERIQSRYDRLRETAGPGEAGENSVMRR